jgi:hypothetical protein
MAQKYPGPAPLHEERWNLAWRRWLADFSDSVGSGLWNFQDTVYGDYLTSGLAIQTTGPNPPDLEELRTGVRLFAFAGTGATVEQAFFTVHLLHDLKADTTPTFHVHWTHNTAVPTGNVVWQIDYSYARGYEVDTFPAVTSLSTTDAAAAQYIHHITADDDMPFNESTAEPDGLILCRIYRDPAHASDTFENDAFLVGIDLHYQLGQIGTNERNRPWGGEYN